MSGNAHAQGASEGRSHGLEDFKHIAHSVVKTSSVGIASLVGDGGEKLVQQIAMCCVQFNGIDANALGAFGRFDKVLQNLVHARFVQRLRCALMCLVRDRTGGQGLPPPFI